MSDLGVVVNHAYHCCEYVVSAKIFSLSPLLAYILLHLYLGFEMGEKRGLGPRWWGGFGWIDGY